MGWNWVLPDDVQLFSLGHCLAIKPLMLWSGPSAFLTLDFSLRSSQVWMWAVARMGMASSAEGSCSVGSLYQDSHSFPLQRERTSTTLMRSRKGRRTSTDQPGEKRCLVISPGGISLWTCFGCRWTFGKPQHRFLWSLLYLWPHLLTYYELYRGRKLLSNSQSYGFLF